jgi:hypothetical protein
MAMRITFGLVTLLGLATAKAPADPPRPAEPPAENPRVTHAAFDRIQWLMPSKEIEGILGPGERVDNSVVCRALGPKPPTRAELHERAELGLWMQWKGKNHTIFVQFGGPTLMQNQDGSYSIGPNTQCGLVLFVADNPTVARRDADIDWKLGPRAGHIHLVER